MTPTYKYLTIRDLAEMYGFSMSTIRNWLFGGNRMGLRKCVRKIGKRIYIREDLFKAWFESHALVDDIPSKEEVCETVVEAVQ